MRIYTLKLDKPEWHFDPPTNRQIKVLKFFGVNISEGLNKGVASGIVGRLFRDEENRTLWEKYLFLTGDESQESPELAPFEAEELRSVVIPDDWSPKRVSASGKRNSERRRAIVAELLKDNSPFDDPLPEITFKGKSFVFTEPFESGSRKDCFSAVEKLGAVGHQSVKASTDYLVIGSKAKRELTRKIVDAMIRRLDSPNPQILSESDWLDAVQWEEAMR